MEEKYKSQNISYIYEQFLEILLMQIRSLYEEYDETYLDEFELKYRQSYRDLIKNSLEESDLGDKIRKLIMIEPDPYGLDTMENDIRIIISDIFRNIGIQLSIESMTIKDAWKEDQVGHLKNEILRLREQVKLDKLEVDKLNNEIYKEKDKNINLQLQIDSIKKQLELLEEDNRNNVRYYEIEINNYKNKLNQSEKKSIELSKEKEVLKVKIKELEKYITAIKHEENKEYIKAIKNLEKEIEHLKSGIEMFKLKNTEKEKKMKELMDKNDEINTENKELENKLLEKDKKIELLKNKLSKLNTELGGEKEEPVITMEEIKKQYEDIYEELRNQLIKIISEVKIIGGKNIKLTASNINKLAKDMKDIKKIIDFESYLEELLLELEEFNNLFEENNKGSGLIPSIDNLKNLKDRVKKGKVWR